MEGEEELGGKWRGNAKLTILSLALQGKNNSQIARQELRSTGTAQERLLLAGNFQDTKRPGWRSIPTPAFMPQALRHRTFSFAFQRRRPPGPSSPDLVSNLPPAGAAGLDAFPSGEQPRGPSPPLLPSLLCLNPPPGAPSFSGAMSLSASRQNQVYLLGGRGWKTDGVGNGKRGY